MLMNNIRILLLADSPYLGGMTSHILSIVDSFRGRSGFEFVVATFPGQRSDNTLIEVARNRGITVHVFPMSCKFDVRVLGAFRNFISDQHIDLIHAHSYRSTLVPDFASVEVPVITTSHGMAVEPTLSTSFWQWVMLRSMRKQRLNIACSDYVRDWLISKGLDGNRVRTVHNCYSLPQSVEANVELRRELGIPDDDTIVLYMGRLVPGKGVEVLIESLRDLTGLSLVVAGEGPLCEDLQKQSDEAGVSVYFVGRTDSPSLYYKLADVVVLPSQMEALPIVLIEAAAYGKSAIATREGGMPEVVRDGESGILVTYGDISELRNALEKCMDPEIRNRMGQCAKEIWQENFTAERMASDLSQIYREVVEN